MLITKPGPSFAAQSFKALTLPTVTGLMLHMGPAAASQLLLSPGHEATAELLQLLGADFSGCLFIATGELN